jgi:hypothetical protein
MPHPEPLTWRSTATRSGPASSTGARRDAARAAARKPTEKAGTRIEAAEVLEASKRLNDSFARGARLRQLGMPQETNYAMREHVRQELEFGNQLFRSHPDWPVVDVTGRAIEETAVIILETIKERDERARAVQSSLI